MKFLTAFTILFLALPALADSWDNLQKSAEAKFLNETQIETKVGTHPAKTVLVEFEKPITKVVLNRIDNPLFKTTKAYTEYVFSLTRDVDFVEIFLYAGDEKLNCYAAFENGSFRDLTRCSKD